MRLVVVVALLAAGCGGESQGVEVTEADDSPPSRTVRPPDPRAPLDTVYADSGLFVDPSLQLDSLSADSLRRDSVRQDSLAQVPVAPDFRTFWPEFRIALEDGPAAAASLAAIEGDAESAIGRLLVGPFLDGALALSARDFRRAATSRMATVIVGYDADGTAVPQENALTESAVTLRFDVLEGEYRLVGLEVAG
ncbi:hypothetical protein [Rubrivirga sp.]|uniref:hypothetical protein n=1 Tax=Rubrivirga sp. TaxID=1885344 RepID=UPI003C75BC63